MIRRPAASGSSASTSGLLSPNEKVRWLMPLAPFLNRRVRASSMISRRDIPSRSSGNSSAAVVSMIAVLRRSSSISRSDFTSRSAASVASAEASCEDAIPAASIAART